MLENARLFLKAYSIVAISIIGMRIFLKRKTNELDLAALVPTFILICNI